jgi:hypothetical protein
LIVVPLRVPIDGSFYYHLPDLYPRMLAILYKTSQILKSRSFMMFVYMSYWSVFSDCTGNVRFERLEFLELSAMDLAFCYVALHVYFYVLHEFADFSRV